MMKVNHARGLSYRDQVSVAAHRIISDILVYGAGDDKRVRRYRMASEQFAAHVADELRRVLGKIMGNEPLVRVTGPLVSID